MPPVSYLQDRGFSLHNLPGVPKGSFKQLLIKEERRCWNKGGAVKRQWVQFSSVAQSVVSSSLPLHGLQHARPPCPSPTPRIYSNSCPLSRWCHPTISSSVVRSLLLPPSIFSSIRVFSNELVLRIQWPKDQSFSFTISPSNEYSGLISFRMNWLYFLAVQGTLKSLLQYHSSKASTFWHLVFFLLSSSHISTWLLEKP